MSSTGVPIVAAVWMLTGGGFWMWCSHCMDAYCWPVSVPTEAASCQAAMCITAKS
jgi:hypothetical protein